MSRRFRSMSLGLIVTGVLVLGVFAVARGPMSSSFRRPTIVPMMKYVVRTSAGLPLASIFDGVTGSRLDARSRHGESALGCSQGAAA